LSLFPNENRGKERTPNQFLQADPGDSAGKIGLRIPEGDPDPENDLSPPRSAEKCVSCPTNVHSKLKPREEKKKTRHFRQTRSLAVTPKIYRSDEMILSPRKPPASSFFQIEWLYRGIGYALVLKIFVSANHRLHPTTGILPVKLGYRRSEGDSDLGNDLDPPVAGETERWVLSTKLKILFSRRKQ
jgi:hypothetical protein